LVHPALRNTAKRKMAEEPPSLPPPKSYWKCWDKYEIDVMLHLEIELNGNPRIVKRTTAFVTK
jgi:hypothetical protein